MKRQQGFTLIELMIVVAIIGILAAIAIPQYQNYVARAQAAEAITLLSGAKTPVEEYATTNGGFPDSTAFDALGVKTSGTYVSSIKSENAKSDGSGDLKATFKSSKISSELQGKTIIFQRTESGTSGIFNWSCDTTNSTVASKFLPAPCN